MGYSMKAGLFPSALAGLAVVSCLIVLFISAPGYGAVWKIFDTENKAGNLNATGNISGAALCIGTDCKTAWSQVQGAPSGWAASGSYVYNDTAGVNVGIGLASPGYRLSVAGEVNATIYRDGDDPSNRYLDPHQTSIINILQTTGNALFGDSVGIGVASPGAKLEVNGGVRMNTTTSKPTCDSSQRGTLWFEQSSPGTDDFLYACMRNSTSDYNWVLAARGG